MRLQIYFIYQAHIHTLYSYDYIRFHKCATYIINRHFGTFGLECLVSDWSLQCSHQSFMTKCKCKVGLTVGLYATDEMYMRYRFCFIGGVVLPISWHWRWGATAPPPPWFAAPVSNWELLWLTIITTLIRLIMLSACFTIFFRCSKNYNLYRKLYFIGL